MTQRILLLENDADLAMIAKAALEGAGYTVDTATTVGEAISCAQLAEPTLALVDLLLDGESGWGFVEWARESKLSSRIAAYSVHHQEEFHLERARTLHVDALLAKTGDPEELVRAVRALLPARVS